MGLGTRSRISEEESGSKLAESEVAVEYEVDGMRDELVTSEGGAGEAGVSFSRLMGVAAGVAVVVDDMAGIEARKPCCCQSRAR